MCVPLPCGAAGVLCLHFFTPEAKCRFTRAIGAWKEVGQACWNGVSELINETSIGLVILFINWILLARDSSKTQAEDCLEMLSDGIDVLIITPNNTRKVDDVLMYAKQKNTKVVSYARAVMGGNVDLFVGYDCYKIGQNMGQHLTEKVYHGDIIVLKGDVNDFNTPFLYYGAMKYIKPLIENGKLNMVLDAYVPKWSPAEAKKLVKEAVAANGNRIDAIFASNDRLAAAAIHA